LQAGADGNCVGGHRVSRSTKREIVMRNFLRLTVPVALVLATAAGAFAQSRPPGPGANQRAPNSFDAQPGQQRGQSLSERLDQSGGVIHPPSDVDSGIHVTPPATGDKMPIVPAPGSPGGDPTVKPK
jgi:hypothetical protein